MNGTVAVLKRKGFLAVMDGPADTVPIGTRFEVYRVVDGVETIVGTGVSKVFRQPNLLKVNPEDGAELGEPRLGDLVRQL